MIDIFDLMGRRTGQRYGTGIWPFYYPRPWNMNPPPGIGAINDPVAIACEVSIVLRKIGWPGISLMDRDFQMAVLDAPAENVSELVKSWFTEHREEVADLLTSRLANYHSIKSFKTAEQAMNEAIFAYREAKYLNTTRVVMPEFESIGRSLLADPANKTLQSKVINDLQEALRATPLIRQDPLEAMSLFHFIDERLFAFCRTEADAAAFGGVPNRHAELHGYDSYGNLQGASVVICAFDLMLKMLHTQIDLGNLIVSS